VINSWPHVTIKKDMKAASHSNFAAMNYY
jgi:hypothetical protein